MKRAQPAVRIGQPEAISQDGLGERGQTPNTSPVEAAYRRGVQQAFFWAKRMEEDEIRRMCILAGTFRYDGKKHEYLLDEMEHEMKESANA